MPTAGWDADTMLHDIFISHASEDKNDFVRRLAKALQKHRVDVWYDEFSLKPGDSLRGSIDRGLSQSRFGLVVLSKHFFQKRWTEWELDGLLQRQFSSTERLIIPIWHGVDREAVVSYSPSLANLVAIPSSKSLGKVVKELLAILFPEGSTLLIARNALIKRGLVPPVVTDDWWLDIIESSHEQWEKRWNFPVWKMIAKGSHRGEYLAWDVLQDAWQREAESRPITQITPPKMVLEFINSQPGLKEVCARFPESLLDYAPQLAIRGLGGEWEPLFDELLASSTAKQRILRQAKSAEGKALTTDKKCPVCEDTLALRHSTFGNYSPAHVACGFVQGNGAGVGPVVKAFDTFDYLMWLLSKQSNLIPGKQHFYLLRGMKDWGVWIQYGDQPRNPAFKPIPESGTLAELLFDALDKGGWKRFRMSPQAAIDLSHRITASRVLLQLPESTDQLVQNFHRAECIKSWFGALSQRTCRRNKGK
jgi:hypothetical protein